MSGGTDISEFFKQEHLNRVAKSLRQTRSIAPVSGQDKKIVFLPETISEQVQNLIKEIIKKKNIPDSDEMAWCKNLYLPVLKATKIYSSKNDLENFIDALMKEAEKSNDSRYLSSLSEIREIFSIDDD